MHSYSVVVWSCGSEIWFYLPNALPVSQVLDLMISYLSKDSGKCSVPKFLGTGVLKVGERPAMLEVPFKLRN